MNNSSISGYPWYEEIKNYPINSLYDLAGFIIRNHIPLEICKNNDKYSDLKQEHINYLVNNYGSKNSYLYS